MNTERNNAHEELLSELAWCIGNGNTGPRSLAALEKARAALASSPSPAQPQPNDDLLPHLRQFMHNDGSGFVAGYDKQGVDRLVAYLQAKARPQFEIADDLIEWLDTLYTTEGNAITNQKWEPAQRAIAALRAPVSPVAQPQDEREAMHAEYGDTDFGFTFAGIQLEEGDKRLASLIIKALGTAHPAMDDLVSLLFRARATPSQDAVDAARYRAITARHSVALVSRFIDKRGYSNQWAKARLDAWADAAVADIAAWDAMTPEQKEAHWQRELDTAMQAQGAKE